MRKIVLLLSVLLFSAANAEHRSGWGNGCSREAETTRPVCMKFFEKFNTVRMTLRAARVLTLTIPADVCDGLWKLKQIEDSEYSDCVRILEDDATKHPETFE